MLTKILLIVAIAIGSSLPSIATSSSEYCQLECKNRVLTPVAGPMTPTGCVAGICRTYMYLPEGTRCDANGPIITGYCDVDGIIPEPPVGAILEPWTWMGFVRPPAIPAVRYNPFDPRYTPVTDPSDYLPSPYRD